MLLWCLAAPEACVGFFAQEEAQNTDELVGVDINTGEACIPLDEGIVDNYCVKRQLLKSCTMIASSLLLVDEVMRAGLSSLKQ